MASNGLPPVPFKHCAIALMLWCSVFGGWHGALLGASLAAMYFLGVVVMLAVQVADDMHSDYRRATETTQSATTSPDQ